MMRRVAMAIVLLLVVPASAFAQPATMGDFVSAVRFAASAVELEQSNPEISEELEENLELIKESGATYMTVRDAAARIERPGPMTMAHRKQDDYGFGFPSVDAERFTAAVTRVRQIANTHLYGPLVEALGTEEAANAVWQPLTAYHQALLEESLESDLEKLHRYEKKFGPGTPQLNVVELPLNYLVQGLPAFGPDKDGFLGPLEIVAGYDTAYLTAVDQDLGLMSAAEFGVRYYVFREGWGDRDGLLGLLRPGYFSFGLVVAGEENGPLVWPWEGKSRVGGFFSWGVVKFAYVSGDESRFMVTRELELVPWLF